MRLILTQKEAMEIKNIMESVETGSVEDMLESAKNSPLVTIVESEEIVAISVDAEYMEEYLEEAADLVSVVTPLCYSVYNAFVSAGMRIDKLVRKHISKNLTAVEKDTKATKIEIEIK